MPNSSNTQNYCIFSRTQNTSKAAKGRSTSESHGDCLSKYLFLSSPGRVSALSAWACPELSSMWVWCTVLTPASGGTPSPCLLNVHLQMHTTEKGDLVTTWSLHQPQSENAQTHFEQRVQLKTFQHSSPSRKVTHPYRIKLKMRSKELYRCNSKIKRTSWSAASLHCALVSHGKQYQLTYLPGRGREEFGGKQKTWIRELLPLHCDIGPVALLSHLSTARDLGRLQSSLHM